MRGCPSSCVCSPSTLIRVSPFQRCPRRPPACVPPHVARTWCFLPDLLAVLTSSTAVPCHHTHTERPSLYVVVLVGRGLQHLEYGPHGATTSSCMASGVPGVSSRRTIENQEDGGRLVGSRGHAMTPCEEEAVNSSKLPKPTSSSKGNLTRAATQKPTALLTSWQTSPTAQADQNAEGT